MEQERGEGGTGLEPGLWGPRSHNATVLKEAWQWDPRGTSLGNSCPSSSAHLSEANHLFKASSRAWQAKGSCLPTPPPILAGTLVTQEVSSGPHGWEYPGETSSGWDGTFPKQPSEDIGFLLGPMASLPNPFISQAATQVGLNGQINSSPGSIENLSEIPLSHKGVSPASPTPHQPEPGMISIAQRTQPKPLPSLSSAEHTQASF